MIWHYFPIGMRFPVVDFSDETRRACWKIALSAAFASDASKTGLYEACETYDPISQSPVYICIICYGGIKQSRAAGETLHSLDALMTRLCLLKPLVQANDLESFGPYPILAEIDSQGTIRPNENGAAFIPTEATVPMRQSEGFRILIAPDSMNGIGAEQVSRVIGTAAADHRFRVRRLSIASGGKGTVRALVAGCGGRYETVACEDGNGERKQMLVGILPGFEAVIEAADAAGDSHETEQTPPNEKRSSFGVGMLIRKTMDLGYRKIRIALGDAASTDLGLGALSALGVRFTDSEGNSVTPCPETLPMIKHVDRTELDPRVALTELTLLYDTDVSLIDAEGIGDCGSDRNLTASLLGGDPTAPGSGAGGGLGFALASVGGKLHAGTEMILDRIGIGPAIREADFVIVGDDCFNAHSIRSGRASAAVTERLSDADRPGCLFVRALGTDPDKLLKDFPKLKGVVTCDADEESYDVSILRAFDRSILPMIGKDIANLIEL